MQQLAAAAALKLRMHSIMTPAYTLMSLPWLSALQWGVLVTDNAPGSSSSSVSARSATFSFHQLLHGGETSLAAEYSMPLAPPGALHVMVLFGYSHFLNMPAQE
jgi:hypothetical protein